MKKSQNRIAFLMMGFTLVLVFGMLLTNCGGKTTKAEEEAAQEANEQFYAAQPVESGLYDADYYDIKGKNPRKGHFDGRIYFALSPEFSAFYVFENGNRTKIKMFDSLSKPFEKSDSGFFCAVDAKDFPVTVYPDSAGLVLDFIHTGDTVKIQFNPVPRHTGTAVEIAEKIKAQREKK